MIKDQSPISRRDTSQMGPDGFDETKMFKDMNTTKVAMEFINPRVITAFAKLHSK
jgi:hypothetical protein